MKSGNYSCLPSAARLRCEKLEVEDIRGSSSQATSVDWFGSVVLGPRGHVLALMQAFSRPHGTIETA